MTYGTADLNESDGEADDQEGIGNKLERLNTITNDKIKKYQTGDDV